MGRSREGPLDERCPERGRAARSHIERTEFLLADQSKDGQELKADYLAATDSTGELPLYNPNIYARALESGRVPGQILGKSAVAAQQPRWLRKTHWTRCFAGSTV